VSLPMTFGFNTGDRVVPIGTVGGAMTFEGQ